MRFWNNFHKVGPKQKISERYIPETTRRQLSGCSGNTYDI